MLPYLSGFCCLIPRGMGKLKLNVQVKIDGRTQEEPDRVRRKDPQVWFQPEVVLRFVCNKDLTRIGAGDREAFRSFAQTPAAYQRWLDVRRFPSSLGWGTCWS